MLKTDKMGRVRISRQRREAILDAFERSGMSGAAFAQLHGLSYSTFAGWAHRRRRKRNGAASTKASGEAPLALAEVMVKRPSDEEANRQKSEGLRVEAPGGSVLFITERSQLPWAAELLRALSSC